MKKYFLNREQKVCYIDREEFYDMVNRWDIVITKEFPNVRIKECNDGCRYELMGNWDWVIEVSEKDRCMGQYHKYQVHSKLGRFPTEPIVDRYRPAFVGWWWKIRYEEIYVKGIEWEENWGSMNMYTNDRNGKWRKLMTKAWFKVIDVD